LTPAEEIAPLADIPLEIEAELDRTTMNVSKLLALQPGSVLWLTRSAGESLDILVGRALVGFGEIVILESMMGVRITDFNCPM
jgi:flagellar motor switch protein FliN/FliY